MIDEALDIIEEAQLDLQKVRLVRALIPVDVALAFPAQMDAIAAVEQLLLDIARIAKERSQKEPERILSRGTFKMPDDFDMTPLRRALRGARLDRALLRRSDEKENKKLDAKWDTTLRGIQSTLSNWNWYAKKLTDHTMNTARLIVPENIKGAVIMDATASSNLIYELFEKAEVLPVIPQASSYRNVTLHVSTGHAVGKSTLVKNAREECSNLIDNLKSQLGPDRSVFVCCHQFVEPHMIALDTGFAKFDVGHSGAIDGRNDWQAFDTAVIFGLPYRGRGALTPSWHFRDFRTPRGSAGTGFDHSSTTPTCGSRLSMVSLRSPLSRLSTVFDAVG